MTSVDTLVTEYLARDRASHVAEGVARANDRLHGILLKVGAALAAIDVAHKAIDFAGRAQDAAVAYTSLEARLKALTGSAEEAHRKLKIAELVAAPSPFTTKQLSDAAVTLEAFSLNAERSLPILGKLGAAMGAGDEQIQMFTRALGELGQGNFIDAEVLARMGLSRRDFATQGIEFDGSGKLLSSAQDTLEALERIVNERFGNILEEMASTPEAKRASLQDTGERVMRQIGMGILRVQAPLMESITNVLNGLASSGVIEEATTKISDAILSIFGSDKTEAVARFVSFVIAAFQNLPDILGAIFENIREFFRGYWPSIAEGALKVFNEIKVAVLQVLAILQGTLGAINAMSWDNPKTPLQVIGETMQRIQALQDWGVAQDKAMAARHVEVAPPSYRSIPAIFGGQEEIFRRIMAGATAPQGGLPDTSGVPFLKRPEEKAQETLEMIAKNTGDTASYLKPVDVRSILFGGGDRARAGISFADLSRSRGGMGGYSPRGPMRLDVRVSKGASDLERALAGIVRQLLPEVSRALGVPIGGL